MLTLARELVRRGHSATFLHMPDAEALVRDGGVGFHPVGHDTHQLGHLAGMVRRMAAIDGFMGLPAIIRDVAQATAMLVRDLPAALRAIGADIIVCDGTEAAGGLVAAHLGLPIVTVANALPLNREPSVPPPFTGWRYDTSRWGLERNSGGYRVSDILMRPHRAVIAEAAERWKLGSRRTVADCLSPFAEISQTVAGFDFPRAELPATFHHVGPMREARAQHGGVGGFELPKPDGRPLAYASLGTLQGGRLGIFRRIAAAADQIGLRLVLAHGGRLSDEEAASLPGTPAAFAYVPQDEVLACADIAFLNGGLNTVMDALTVAVPMVVVPIAFEQAAIAARLERVGAGRRVSRRFLTAGRLARAAAGILDGPGFRVAARGLANEIAKAGGAVHASDIVEAVLSTSRPVTQVQAAQLKASRETARPAAPASEERAA